jgi:UDP-N-acetylmuramoyl-tripeptide--D-alanyl-D-alanine ligase
VNGWGADRIATAAGARLVRGGEGAPCRVVIDSREAQPGDLFVGLRGERVDGGAYAEQALRAGAWGVLVTPEHADGFAKGAAASESTDAPASGASAAPAYTISQTSAERVSPLSVPVSANGAVLAHPDPLAAMQALAREWRKALGEEGAKVVGITGSTGKTSTKDILAALLRDARERLGGDTVASRANLNTEIGLPLTVLAAPAGTKTLVLEMAMRGAGQIAELTAIAQPEVGVIVNVGPVHLQQLGSLEAVAAAKAELIAGMAPGATVVVPAGEPLLEPHLRSDQQTVTFGEGGDVEMVGHAANGEVTILDRTHAQGASGARSSAESQVGKSQVGKSQVGKSPVGKSPVGMSPSAESPDDAHPGERITVRPSFAQSHNLRNLLAATAAARALGVTPHGRLDVEFSALRGERVTLANGIVLINDCYNANPMSMRAALDELAASEGARRVAVLGDMLELGGEERRLHREIGEYARARGVDLLLTVGPMAREMGEGHGDGWAHSVPDAAAAAALLGRLLRAGDVVLVKGSRGMELERVAQALATAPTGGGSSTASAERAGSPVPTAGASSIAAESHALRPSGSS